MIHLKLVKDTSRPLVAHVYEHMYCFALAEFLRSKKLIDAVDYHFDAQTYSTGLVKMEIFCYTPEARQISSNLKHIRPSIDQDHVYGALHQIIAERQQEVSFDEQRLFNDLRSIAVLPWHASAFSTKHKKAVDEPIYFVDSTSKNFVTLDCVLELNASFAAEHVSYIPLFQWLAFVCLQNITTVLSDYFWIYKINNLTARSIDRLTEGRQFRIYTTSNYRLTQELDVIKSELRRILRLGLVKKVVHFLANATYERPMSAPDRGELSVAAKHKMTAEDWHWLAQEEYCMEILKHVSITVSIGRQKLKIEFPIL